MSWFKKILGLYDPFSSRKQKLSFRENLSALRVLPRLFRMIWETDRSLTLLNIVLRIIKAALPLATLYVGKLIIDAVVVLQQEGGPTTFLWTVVGIELGLALLSDVLNRLIGLTDSLLGDLFANMTSVKLMDHAARMDLSMFEDAKFYDKLERARQQTVGRVVLMSKMLLQVQDLLTISFLIAGLAVVSPWLILLLIVAVLPAFLTEVYYNRSSYSLTRSWTPERRELDYLRYIGASDTTAKEIKIFGLSDFLTERFGTLAHRYYLANRNLAVRRTAWGTIFNAFGIGAYYAAYVYIIGDTIQGRLSIGDLTFLAGSFMRLRTLLQGMLSRFSSIAQNALYLQDLFDFFELKSDIASPEAPAPFPVPVQQGITFENVGFRYPGTDRWAVRHLNFTLQAGEKLALVGENGAGKTTLVKLLARLYDPTEGRILLDGRDLRSYDLKDLRNAIGVIFQDFVRFYLAARENIGVGRVEAMGDRPRIEDAAHKSLADTVVNQLEGGYDQMLGRRFKKGVELSGGEWQKVALARAYMRDAQILVLDEPTAALDARAEYEVFQRFSELTQGKSAVLISHRFSTVRMADRILVLRAGEMVELGSHEALVTKKGLYAELFELQARGYK
ncbi:MAG: ABC transporter ATP-binding protein [Bacteroidota bacterium]